MLYSHSIPSGGILENRKTLLIAAVLACILLAFHFIAKKQPVAAEAEGMFNASKEPAQWHGKTAPDFEIDLLSGDKFVSADQVGKKVIVLNFFATWCGPCREELPELNRYYDKHREEQFILIGINAEESQQKVGDFMQEFNVKFPVSIDKDGGIQKLFGVRGFPTTVLIGADGTIQIYEVGPVMNADVAFDALYKAGTDMIKAGKGIERETYLAKSKQAKDALPKGPEKVEDDKYKLEGRSKVIAEKMYCPCGCSDILNNCTCKTAGNIKEKLKTYEFADGTDDEVIKELNKEFCVRGNKSSHD
jgi:thiol-disulfide isomerase/thioredoxin